MKLRRFIPRFRFSLRTMMIIVTLVAVFLGLWGKRYFVLRARQEARLKLQDFGFRFLYRYDDKGVRSGHFPILRNDNSEWNYQWDRFCYGHDLANPIEEVSLYQTPGIRVDWAIVGKNIVHLQELTLLDFNNCNSQSDDLQFLGALPNLRVLKFHSESDVVSPAAGISKHVLKNNKLQEVALAIPMLMPDELWIILDKSPNLKYLTIPFNAIDSKSIKELKARPLEYLTLRDHQQRINRGNLIEELLSDKSWNFVSLDGPARGTATTVRIQNSHVHRLSIGYFKEVVLEDQSRTKQLELKFIDRLTVRNCSGLEIPDVIYADKISIEDCSGLTDLKIGSDGYEIKNLPDLTKLRISSDQKSNPKMGRNRLEELKSLKIVSIEVLGKSVASDLAKLPNLETVKFDDLHYPDVPAIEIGALQELSKSKSLRKLAFPDRLKLDSVLSELSHFEQLAELSIGLSKLLIDPQNPEKLIKLPPKLQLLKWSGADQDGKSILPMLREQFPNWHVRKRRVNEGSDDYEIFLQGIPEFDSDKSSDSN